MWDWFVDLHNTRQYGFSANPISYQEIDSFCRLTGAVIPWWELSVIRRMDTVVVAILNKTGGRKDEAEADPERQKASVRAAAKGRRVVKREGKPNG
ncbi:phage tail assembly chaperone [Xaviernesmea oryzae]|uniref:phage tail assembly chaperone n=1 Tax=Xaviernesmea oryzae TaxID=464029 RepID=UPI003C6ECDE6